MESQTDGKVLHISKRRLSDIISSSVRCLPPDTDPSPYRNWALVTMNPATLRRVTPPPPAEQLKRPIADAVETSPKTQRVDVETDDTVVEVAADGPWLVPFAITGMPLRSLYDLGVIRMSVHGAVVEGMCCACLYDLECFNKGRNVDEQGYKCPGTWSGITHLRKGAHTRERPAGAASTTGPVRPGPG